MQQPGEVGTWYIGQRVQAVLVDGIVPAGTCGIIRHCYQDTNSLMVLFDGEWDICLVGGEEVALSDTCDKHERPIGDVSF
jgi:hypothetical protein